MNLVVIYTLLTKTVGWNSETEPDPPTALPACNNGFICDPQKLLPNDDIQKINYMANSIKSNSTCLCTDACSDNESNLIVAFVVFRKLSSKNETEFLVQIRESWNLSRCDNDIIFLQAKDDNIQEAFVGEKAKNIIPEFRVKKMLEAYSMYIHIPPYDKGIFLILEDISLEIGVFAVSEKSELLQESNITSYSWILVIPLLIILAFIRLQFRKRKTSFQL